MTLKSITAAILLVATSGALAEPNHRADRMISRLDQNGDSLVSLEEFQMHRGRGGGMLDRADADGDGVVTIAEIEAQHAERVAEAEARRQEAEARFEALLAGLDADNNGIVSDEEARVAAFNRMDSNEDGYLSADEVRPPKRRGGGHGGRHGGKGGPRGD